MSYFPTNAIRVWSHMSRRLLPLIVEEEDDDWEHEDLPPPKLQEKKDEVMATTGPTERIVARTEFLELPWSGYEAHTFNIRHCVQMIQIDPFYGEFELHDSSGRVLGVSNKSRLSLLRKDLSTDVALVWMDALSRTSSRYKTLHETYHVADPGLDLGGLQPVKILFRDAPKALDRRYDHIPIYCRVTCVWDTVALKFVPVN